ncbi:hypothetical protein M3197_01745 [Sporosarcina aquimarina]|uniref:hypothetical protein n=1 Tax=Sporosarcina aquimarina TaxID=114975 RepID=UPI0020412683|nr:hypothetical protein [Sporosarcina aquimarina]MCM3756199.1 hypothetical protein [Sporosarcina aquimarina]
MKTKLAVAVMIILATYLWIYGQNNAYYFNEHFLDINPVIYLTVQTVISILLYILSWIIAYRMVMKRERISGWISLLFSVLVVMGGAVSLWSILVTALWWG